MGAGAIALAGFIEGTDTINVKTKPCCVCGKQHDFVLNREKFLQWQDGAKIQNVFSEMSIDDREILISGTCGPCFDKLFPPLEEE